MTTRSMLLMLGGVWCVAGSAAGQTYHVRDIGSLGGLGDVACFDLRGASPRVAGFATGSDLHHTAFVWDGAAMAPIAPIGADTQSAAFGVDGLGRVVGVSYALGEPAVHAFRWDQGAAEQLGGFTPRAVNAAGDIVGFMSTTDSWGLRVEHACILPAAWPAPVDLGTLFGSSTSQAYDINSRGQVVGISNGSGDQGTRAALWWLGMRIDMGTLGGDISGAQGINENNLAVGWSDAGGPTPTYRATKFLLDAGGLVVSRVNMGVLPPGVPGGGSWSFAYGVNNAGSVVGQSNGRGFVDVGRGMQDVNALIPDSPAWFIAEARAIDDAGRVAGWGVDAAGRPRPVLLVRCDADFSRDGAVSVQDIFDFLAAWFTGAPRADFNVSGAVTVQDIFDFLGAWFAGCA